MTRRSKNDSKDTMMKTRKLGWTDLELTVVGLGTWAMGGSGWAFAWGPQDDRESGQAIRRALDLGINWIDTAPAYGLGHAEEVVGKTLQELGQKPIIATKCGRSWNDQRQLYPSLRKKVVRAEAEASLKRLRVDVIDLYQIHWPQPDEEIEEGWDAVASLIQDGKIRYGGVSNFSVAQLQRLEPMHRVASLQPPYSMLARDVEQELLPYCAEKQMGVVAYSPMQKGLLTGAFSAERVEKLPEDDHRRRDPQFQGEHLRANLELVEGLRRIAKKQGRSVGELAVAWTLLRPEVTAAIVGGRQAAQVEETAGAADWEWTPEDRQAVEDLLRKRAGQGER